MTATDIRPEFAAPPRASLPVDRFWKADYGKIALGDAVSAPLSLSLPDAARAQGVVLCSLGEAQAAHADVVGRGLHSSIVEGESRFLALASERPENGFFFFVPAGVKLAAPIEIDLGAVEAWNGRGVVVIGEGASASVVERFTNAGTATCCGAVEIVLEAGARLEYSILQLASETARSFMTRRAVVARDAVMVWADAEIGCALSRSVIDAVLAGGGAQVVSTSLLFADGERHLDLSDDIDHHVAATRSDTVVKGAATGNGRGRFYGNIRMQPLAVNSEATLRDDTLVLSPSAHVDSVPALEIATNDVRAFHGATVGTVDDEQRFYAMSRGLSAGEAERMIALGFFEPAIARFPIEAQRELLRTELARRVDSDAR